jgi:predicted ATP-grasp superfamily ATP-dependent carboligase
VDKPERIVILDSGSTALAVARCARRLGLEPVVFDSSAGIATASRLLRAEICAEARQEAMLTRLRELARKRRSLLIAASDTWLRFLINHRPVLDECFDHVLHPDNAALETCLDKARFSAWCAQHDLPAPRRFELQGHASMGTTLPFPLLVRPGTTLHAVASAGLKAMEVHSSTELNAAMARLTLAQRDAVVSESLLGRPLQQFSVGVARRGDEILTVVSRKLRPAPSACATGTLVETTVEAVVEGLARRVAGLLNLHGIAEVEILQDTVTGENFLIEVNPRPWLQFALGAATGRDLLGLVALGRRDCTPAVRHGRAARWLDFRADLRAWVRMRTSDRKSSAPGFWTLLRSMSRANVFARWARNDQGPFWRDLAEMLRLRREHPAGTGRQTLRAAGSVGRFQPPP